LALLKGIFTERKLRVTLARPFLWSSSFRLSNDYTLAVGRFNIAASGRNRQVFPDLRRDDIQLLCCNHYPTSIVRHVAPKSSSRIRLEGYISIKKRAMEPARNLYKNDIDFAALALQSRDFAKQYVTLSRWE
jgi:hypothetical protein